jgi:uncharacterized repeat protein (TIGR02543 family)
MFAGWYADTAFTQKFNFNQPLYKYTEVYAKSLTYDTIDVYYLVG